MTKALLLTFPVSLLLLTGCMDGRPGPMPGPVRDCRAGPAQRFIGLPMRPRLAERARHASGARSVRVIRPGGAVTMDFRPDRLNIDVGERNIVRGVRCG